tara:strand:- start:949 stop:1533 length:585 start_codon:yes stop_codon:yes gene_type:complete
MKANEILNKIKNIVGVELSETKTELAEIVLENGTVLVAESFEAGKAIFIKTEEEEIALPVGEYEYEGKVLVIKEEGLIDSIKEAEAEAEAEEDVEAEEVEAKEEVQFVSVEQFNSTIEELKALITELKSETELSEETKEETEEEVVTELSSVKDELVEPIKHNPEEDSKNVLFTIASNRTETTKDRVYNKIFNN